MAGDVTEIGKSSRVTLHYTLSLADGHIVETTRETSPATHVMGKGDWLPVLEDRLLGLCAGDSRRFEIGAAEVGAPETPAPQVMPRDEFPPELKLEPGQVIGFALPSGEEIPGRFWKFPSMKSPWISRIRSPVGTWSGKLKFWK